jgi:hypothetical protein
MGAHNFYTVSHGSTINEAYRSAVDTAHYEYGHDAYNGTISTTSGVVDKTSEFKRMLNENQVDIDDKEGVENVLNMMDDLAVDNTDKWGSCWGWNVVDNEYHFAGWAAS